MNDSSSKDERHRQRMQRKKEHVDSKIATATIERGVLVVNTGNGKGKSSSAFGMVARALGHGMRVGVVQFIKGAYETGEEAFFKHQPNIEFYVMGAGFTWETQDRERDTQAAQQAWAQAMRFLTDSNIHLVVLDELTIALKYGYIAIDDVLSALRSRPVHQHVVITGRAAPPELIELADTVTEMGAIKHAFQKGIKAQKGIEL
ncbi:MAG: cob(I)yrinic acid a,c-diamide adenosyltransferase [Gammaproteobacteria bacterium]|nr:cob(I)yrinic acid a,c-diamide adenosyltransferase [Gammaproteobacteria bacterium]